MTTGLLSSRHPLPSPRRRSGDRPLTAARRLTARVLTAGLLTGLVLSGCAEATGPQPDAPPAAPRATTGQSPADTADATPSAPPAGPRVEITVTGRTVDPAPSQVDLAVDQTLTVVVTADAATTLHAHGFDVEVPVPATTPTQITLTGTTPGLYEVELHHPDLLLLQVAVR